MFRVDINNGRGICGVHFGHFFSEQDQSAVLDAIPENLRVRVVFIDTPPTKFLVGTIKAVNKATGMEVLVRDHHDVTDAEVAKGGRPAETL